MRNRTLLILLFGLLIVFYFSNTFSKIKTPAKVEIVRNVKSLKLIEEKIQKENRQATTPISSALVIKNGNKTCWENIRDQYQFNSDFLVESRTRLSNVVGEWYYDKNVYPTVNLNENSPQGMFFLALAKANLLRGTKKDVNLEEALTLLEKVSTIDPQNSAPFLYAAIIENKRGNTTNAQNLIKQAASCKYFKSYLRDFMVALFSGVKTPSDLLAAQEIWATTPVPDYIVLKKLIRDPANVKFAYQLIQDGLNSNKLKVTDLSWIPIEYVIGKKILDSHGLGSNIPSMEQIVKQSKGTLNETLEQTTEILDSTCDLTSLQKQVDKIHEYLDAIQ